MNSIPSILSIKPRAPIKKFRSNNYVNEESETLTKKNSNVRLPSLSPSRLVKTLPIAYPITKIGLAPETGEQKFLIASKSNTDFKPNKIISNLGKYRVNRLKAAPSYTNRQTPSPFVPAQSKTYFSEVSGVSKKIYLRSVVNNSIYGEIKLNNKTLN